MKNYIEPNWPAPKQVKAYTTLRHAWGMGDYQSPALREALIPLLSLPSTPIWLNQIHTNVAITATPNAINQPADASFTTTPNCVCVINTADCLPIFITNKAGTEVAAIHAGWRGLANGIIENTINALNSPREELLAWLGPAIGPQKFEVGMDVYEAFTQIHPDAAQAFTPHLENKWLANLYMLATMRLNQLHVTDIYGGQYCTYTQDDLFHSYRRDKPPHCGRMANVIWIEK